MLVGGPVGPSRAGDMSCDKRNRRARARKLCGMKETQQKKHTQTHNSERANKNVSNKSV